MTSPLVTAYRMTDVHAVRYRTAYSAQTALAHAHRARSERRGAAAEVWFKRALSRADLDTATLGAAQRGLAALYLSVGRPRGALSVLAGSRRSVFFARVLHLRARAHHALGQLERAQAQYQQALRELWGQSHKNAARSRLLYDLAVCWDDMGDERRAEMGFRTAARALERTDQPVFWAAALLELGLLVMARDEEEGLVFVEKALFLSEQQGDLAMSRDALRALALAHEARGAHRSALLLRLRAASDLDPRGPEKES